jgi:hypothetical protein
MPYIELVAILAVVQYLAFVALTGQARRESGLKAPTMTGHEGFERMHRVQMNTLETLVAFLPAFAPRRKILARLRGGWIRCGLSDWPDVLLAQLCEQSFEAQFRIHAVNDADFGFGGACGGRHCVGVGEVKVPCGPPPDDHGRVRVFRVHSKPSKRDVSDLVLLSTSIEES